MFVRETTLRVKCDKLTILESVIFLLWIVGEFLNRKNNELFINPEDGFVTLPWTECISTDSPK